MIQPWLMRGEIVSGTTGESDHNPCPGRIRFVLRSLVCKYVASALVLRTEVCGSIYLQINTSRRLGMVNNIWAEGGAIVDNQSGVYGGEDILYDIPLRILNATEGKY